MTERDVKRDVREAFEKNPEQTYDFTEVLELLEVTSNSYPVRIALFQLYDNKEINWDAQGKWELAQKEE